MVKPLERPKIIKKRLKKFIRHQADKFLRVPNKWRRPKGIDSRVRRRYRDNLKMVKIGYGTNAAHRDVLPNGFRKFRVCNASDLEMLVMNNRKFAAEIGSAVSVRKRMEIVQRAAQLNIKVLNPKAKVRTEEHE